MKNKRILIAYATRSGTTGEVAGRIGSVLESHSFQVDVLPVKQVKDLKPYEAAVVGSAVRLDQWLPEATEFVKKHREELGRMPTAFFSVCLTAADPNEERRKLMAHFSEAACKFRPPDDQAFFAGRLELKRLPLLPRLMARGVKVKEGDFRDWECIRAWSESLSARFEEQAGPAAQPGFKKPA